MLQTLMCYAKVHIKNKIIRLNFINIATDMGEKSVKNVLAFSYWKLFFKMSKNVKRWCLLSCLACLSVILSVCGFWMWGCVVGCGCGCAATPLPVAYYILMIHTLFIMHYTGNRHCLRYLALGVGTVRTAQQRFLITKTFHIVEYKKWSIPFVLGSNSPVYRSFSSTE